MKKRFAFIVMVFLVLLNVTGCAKKGPVAIVNGIEITRQDFDAEVEYDLATYEAQGLSLSAEDIDAIKHAALDRLITVLLLKETAAAQGVTIDDAEINEHIELIKGDFDNDEHFNTALEEAGFTDASYRDALEEILIIEALFEQELALRSIQIEDESIEEFVNAYLEGYQGDEPVDEGELREYAAFMLSEERAQALRSEYIERLWQDSRIELIDF